MVWHLSFHFPISFLSLFTRYLFYYRDIPLWLLALTLVSVSAEVTSRLQITSGAHALATCHQSLAITCWLSSRVTCLLVTAGRHVWSRVLSPRVSEGHWRLWHLRSAEWPQPASARPRDPGVVSAGLISQSDAGTGGWWPIRGRAGLTGAGTTSGTLPWPQNSLNFPRGEYYEPLVLPDFFFVQFTEIYLQCI